MNHGIATLRLSAVVLAGALAARAQAAGFQINEHAAPATGRCSAVTATIDDPSAVFHNAAGLTNTTGTQFMVGLDMIKPSGDFKPDGAAEGQKAHTTFIPVPYAYASRALSSKAFIGFGFYAPYGLELKWSEKDNPTEFIGRTVVQEIGLRTFFITPAIALKLSDMVSVAVSVSLVPATVYYRRTLGSTDNGQVLFDASRYGKEGTVELAGSAFGVGANAGVQLTLIDHLKIGINYRSAVDLSFSGKADFQLPDNVPAEIAANFPDQDVDADLTLPHAIAMGIGWVDERFKVEATAQLTLWKAFDELRINFQQGKPVESQAQPQNWKNSMLLKIGGEYHFGDAVGRLGFGYDITPVPDETVAPTLPDNSRILITAGAGYDFGPVRADVGYMLLMLSSRRNDKSVNFSNPPGEYQPGKDHVISLAVGAKF